MDGAFAAEFQNERNESPKEPPIGTIVGYDVQNAADGRMHRWFGMIYAYEWKGPERVAHIMQASLPARYNDIPVMQIGECDPKRQDAILSMLAERIKFDKSTPEVKNYLERLILEQQVKLASKKD